MLVVDDEDVVSGAALAIVVDEDVDVEDEVEETNVVEDAGAVLVLGRDPVDIFVHETEVVVEIVHVVLFELGNFVVVVIVSPFERLLEVIAKGGIVFVGEEVDELLNDWSVAHGLEKEEME